MATEKTQIGDDQNVPSSTHLVFGRFIDDSQCVDSSRQLHNRALLSLGCVTYLRWPHYIWYIFIRIYMTHAGLDYDCTIFSNV